MSEEQKKNAPRKSARSARGGSSARRSRPAKGGSGGSGKIILAGGLTLVVVLGACFALGVFDGEKKKEQGDDSKKQEKAEETIPQSKGSSIFDAADVDSSATEAKRERVTGRAPKTVDMKKLTEHLGRLYMDDALAGEIQALEKDVAEFKRERWDISKELTATYRSLTSKVNTAKRHPFLSGAQDDLKSFNDFTRKREVHLKGADGELLPEPFIGVAHDPFVFMVQADKSGGEKEIADEVYSWMLQLKEEFVRYFTGTIKLEASARHPRIRIVLFRKYKDYANYNRIKNPERDISFALAHYEPSNRRLCVPLDFGAMGSGKDKKHNFREVIFHEGTHQVMHYFTNKDHLGAWGSMWSDEGMAEYFAGHSVDDQGKIHFGKINTRIRSVANDQKDNKRRINFTQLLTWSRSKMERERAKGKDKEMAAQWIHSHVYSQGWALVYFFNHFENGKYKDFFMEVMRRQIEEGDTGLPVWRQILRDKFKLSAEEIEQRFDQIEVAYFDYLDYLTDAFRNGKIKNHILQD